MRPWAVVAGDFVRTGGMDAANHALAVAKPILAELRAQA